MTDKAKTVVKKIVEIVIYVLIGAAAATGIINFDKVTDAFKAGEANKIEQSVQMYAEETVTTVEDVAKTVETKAEITTK